MTELLSALARILAFVALTFLAWRHSKRLDALEEATISLAGNVKDLAKLLTARSR